MDDSFLSYHYPVPELAKKWKMGLEETGRKVRQDAFSRAEADYFGKSETADLQGGEESLPPEKENYGSVLLWPTMKMMWRKLCSTIFAEERG